ncbi:Mut7-C RNAse domain-containing protein [Candidatus Binatia bacterium]|nr:Mut7-C RNAse domain-containing protein [Candidatus Binatia bacterium]
MQDVRFAVDRMLGRLATWLRLLGYDTTYAREADSQALLHHAQTEHRVVLTRKRVLAARRISVPIHLVTADRFRDQLRDVIITFGLDPGPRLLTRCCRCNHLLHPVESAAAAGSVPPYVLRTQPRFFRCPLCRRVYWPASHHNRIRAEIHALNLFPCGSDPGSTSTKAVD